MGVKERDRETETKTETETDTDAWPKMHINRHIIS